MRHEFLLALLLIALFPAVVYAKAVDCKNDLSQSAMNYCSGKDVQEITKQMQTVLKEQLVGLSCSEKKPKECELLDASQSAWEKYMEAECHYQAGFAEGGSVQPYIYHSCQESLTRERVKQLKHRDFIG